MKKLFIFLTAALMSVSLFGKTFQQDISINAADWNLNSNCTVFNVNNNMICTLTGEEGYAQIGWDPTMDISSWDKLVIVVERLNGCSGDDFKLKAWLGDNIGKSLVNTLGLDVQDNVQNLLEIDLTQQTDCDLTKILSLAIQCQPNGAAFTISRIYLEKEVGEPIDVTCKSWDFEDLGGDGEVYLYDKDTTLAFYFDLYYGEGAEDLIPGKVYTVADIYVEEGTGEQYAGVFHDDDWYYGIKILSLTKTIDEGGLVHFVGSLVDSLDVAYTFHYDQPEPKEHVVVGIRFPAENIPTTIELATSNDQWESGAEMEFISSTGFHMNSEIEAYADDTLIFRDANNHETVLCQYVPGNGGGDGKWEVVKLVFGDEWTDDTYKGDPVKFIELELNNASQYAWKSVEVEPEESGVVSLGDVANYIDFQALSESDESMTQSTITSTTPYTLANGSVLKGYKRQDDEEAVCSWNVREGYVTSMPTPTWENVDTLKAGTLLRSAAGVSIELGAFYTAADGKLVVYYQPNGDSERGVEITVKGEAVAGTNLTGSGIKIDGVRPAYAGEIILPRGYYEAGDVVITVIINTCNLFGVGIKKLAETYTLELVSNDESMGTVAVTNLLGSDIIDNEDGTYTVPENTEVSILATPATGYQFDGWKEGNLGEFASCYYCGTAINTIDNPMTITMTADKAILATFSEITGINDVEGNNAQIFGGEKRIVINNAEAANVAIYDVMGREIVKEQRINSNNAVFAMPQRGMYIVRMGNAAKKVFVK